MISRYLIGLDLAQQHDYTVLSVADVTFDSLGTKYSICYLKKFSLNTSYMDIVRWVSSFLQEPIFIDGYVLIADATGVGRPVVDMFRENKINLIALNITSGSTVNWKHSLEVNTPKKDLISALQVVFQNDRIKIAANLDLIEDLKREFLNFKANITKKGTGKFEAASGYHDDIVISIGLAIWYGEFTSKRYRSFRVMSGK